MLLAGWDGNLQWLSQIRRSQACFPGALMRSTRDEDTSAKNVDVRIEQTTPISRNAARRAKCWTIPMATWKANYYCEMPTLAEFDARIASFRYAQPMDKSRESQYE